MSRMIVLEFNELCPSLLAQWMASGDLPNFARFHQGSDVFTTLADVDTPRDLEPWIQWYSVHTGLPYSTHGVFHLTDGPGAGHDDIWQTLNRAGIATANVSGMNARISPHEGSFGIPDPWCTSERSFPPALQPFQDFVQSQVQEYTNRSQKDGLAAMARLGAFLAANGLSFTTAASILRQLAAEKTSQGAVGWRRAVLLDHLLMDVFRTYWRRLQPAYATFFLNSTAHYQHAYWRHMDPAPFTNKPSADEIAQYGDAVLFGYQNMDRLVSEFFKLEAQGATLVLMTALSQQPFLKYEAIGGQRFYRPRQMEALLQAAGIAPAALQPVMTHQYMLRYLDGDAAAAAAAALSRMSVDGSPVFEVRAEATDLYVGCQIRTQIAKDAQLLNGNAALPFFDVFYQIEETKSGCHHPDGVLWIKGGTHRVHAGKVSILDWFPTVLDLYGLAPRTELPGTSLRPRLSREWAVAA